MLTIGGEGSYLIRESQRAPGQFTLAIRLHCLHRSSESVTFNLWPLSEDLIWRMSPVCCHWKDQSIICTDTYDYSILSESTCRARSHLLL